MENLRSLVSARDPKLPKLHSCFALPTEGTEEDERHEANRETSKVDQFPDERSDVTAWRDSPAGNGSLDVSARNPDRWSNARHSLIRINRLERFVRAHEGRPRPHARRSERTLGRQDGWLGTVGRKLETEINAQ